MCNNRRLFDPNRPIIKQARQTNTNSGYKRPIRREPSLDPPLGEELQEILDSLQGKWDGRTIMDGKNMI